MASISLNPSYEIWHFGPKTPMYPYVPLDQPICPSVPPTCPMKHKFFIIWSCMPLWGNPFCTESGKHSYGPTFVCPHEAWPFWSMTLLHKDHVNAPIHPLHTIMHPYVFPLCPYVPLCALHSLSANIHLLCVPLHGPLHSYVHLCVPLCALHTTHVAHVHPYVSFWTFLLLEAHEHTTEKFA